MLLQIESGRNGGLEGWPWKVGGAVEVEGDGRNTQDNWRGETYPEGNGNEDEGAKIECEMKAMKVR